MNSILYRGTVLQYPGKRMIAFPSSVECLGNGQFSLYYSVFNPQDGPAGFAIGRAHGEWNALQCEQALKSACPSGTSPSLTIWNLPNGWNPIQPIHLKLLNGRHRLYFWIHGKGVVRFLAAESDDDVNYTVVNANTPCLYHYNDRATGEKQPDLGGLTWNQALGQRPDNEPEAPVELVCNDPTTVYQLPDGTFEMYSAAIRKANPEKGEVVYADNAVGYCRHIRRFVSPDGLRWKCCGTVLAPDDADAPYLQFYYLAVHHEPTGRRIGFIGRYNVLEQSMDIERCYSEDGVIWNRPERIPFIQRTPQEVMLQAPCNPMVHDGTQFNFFYTSCNNSHNGKYCTELTSKAVVKLAQF